MIARIVTPAILAVLALLVGCSAAPLAPSDPAYRHYGGLQGQGCRVMNRCTVLTGKVYEQAAADARAAAPSYNDPRSR